MADKKEKEELTNRQRLVERFAKGNPEFNGEDDEILYGAVNDALAQSDESAAQRERFNAAMSENAIAPEMLSGIISGKNADGSDFDLEEYLFDKHIDFFIDYLDNSETAKEKMSARRAARETAEAEETAFKADMDAKIQAEDAELDAAIAEMGYRPEQVKSLIDWIYDAETGLVKRASQFELTKDDFLRLFKLKDYDMKMSEAEDRGYKRGRNEKIDMFKREASNRKKLPADIGSGGGGVPSAEKKDKTLDVLDRMKRY